MYGQNNQFAELARETIAKFKCAINANNYKFYGLSSPDALDSLQIGEEIVHYAVLLRDLQNYNEEKDPNELVKEMGYVTVALIDQKNNNAESFVMLTRKDNKYHSTGIGQAPNSKNFLEMKRKTELGKNARLIRVPALNKAYLGIEIKNILNLIPLDGDQKITDPQPASVIFAELARQITKGEDFPH